MALRYADSFFEMSEAQTLGTAAIQGMWPFRVWKGRIDSSYDIDFNRHWILIVIQLHNGDKLAHKEPVSADALVAYPDKVLNDLYEAFFWAFRNREAEPIPDNIILGEY